LQKIKTYAKYVSQNKILIIVFILVVVCGQIFQSLPHNIYENMLDTKFGFGPLEVQNAMNQLGQEGRFAYILSTFTLDTIFPVLYVTFALGLFFKFGFQRDLIYLLPIMAGCIDLCQNIQTSLIMRAASVNEITNFQILLASYTNQAKWIFVVASFVLIVLGFFRKLIIKN
jgi:hypothetical protein